MVGHDAKNFIYVPKEEKMDFEEWLKIGYDNGWIGAPVCYTHDGLPTTSAEEDEFFGGGEPCVHIIRLYEDEDVKRGVEEAHSPSQWRASNRGLGK